LNTDTAETISVTCAKVLAATDIVIASIGTPCTAGQVSVVGASISSIGSFSVKVYNAGSSACTSTYTVVRPGHYTAALFFLLYALSSLVALFSFIRPLISRIICVYPLLSSLSWC